MDLDDPVGAGEIEADPRTLEGELAQMGGTAGGEGDAVGGDAERHGGHLPSVG